MSSDLLVTTTNSDLVPRLGAISQSDLDWLSITEIYSYYDEASNRLAELGLFVDRDTQALSIGTARYAMTANWLASIFVSISNQQLRPASVAELFALDATWNLAQAESTEQPTRYSMDAAQLGTLTTYPVPGQGGTLQTIDRLSFPITADSARSVPIPSVVADYFLYFAIWRARSKESPYQSPEIAAAAQQECAELEQIIASLWGSPE